MNTKLTNKFLNKLQHNETLSISDLYKFSNISLKRKRNRKKFNKHYSRYISQDVIETYRGNCISLYVTLL